MTAYHEYYAAKLESGKCYQDFVCDQVRTLADFAIHCYSSRVYQYQVGESRSAEIKHDERFATTGRLWIEIAEKAAPRPGNYVPSGIMRRDRTWLYIIGDYDTIFVFSKITLRALKASNRFRSIENGTRTSLGFCLPVDVARSTADLVLTPNAERKITSAVRDLRMLGQVLLRLARGDDLTLDLFPPHNHDDVGPA